MKQAWIRGILVLSVLLTFVLSIGFTRASVLTAQTGWQKDGKSWTYLDENGNVQTGWVKIGGKWYYFNASGVVQTGWQKISDKWYWFDASGAMQTGWQEIGEKRYYFNPSGVRQTGWFKNAAGEWCYTNKDGSAYTGWLNNTYYIDDGRMYKDGIQWTNDGARYFDANGKVKKTGGWVKDGDEWFYFNSDGSAYHGWLNNTYFIDRGCMQWDGLHYADDDYLFFDIKGKVVRKGGWQKTSYGEWYYLNSDGTPYTGWVNGTYYIEYGRMCRDGHWSTPDGMRLFDTNGKVVKEAGWVKDSDGKWCYLNSDSTPYTGWVTDTYYIKHGQMCYKEVVWTGSEKGYRVFGSDGKVTKVSGWFKDRYGKWYYFNSDGTAYYGWLDGTYFIYGDGLMCCNGVKSTDKGYCNFDASGKLIKKKGWLEVHGNWYYFNSDGTGYNGWINDTYFIEEGKMLCNGVKKTDRGYCIFASDGKLIRKAGWHKDRGDQWYFFDSDGTPYTGWVVNRTYYIDGGRMLCNEGCEIDGVRYYFDSDGKVRQ